MPETFGEYLQRTRIERGAVSKSQFELSLERLGGFASWALWGRDTHDLSVFEEPRICDRLRRDVFLVGGNTGLFKDGRVEGFSNFHTRGHVGDTKLRKAVMGSPLEGAYLTDIVKDYPTRGAGELIRDIRSGHVSIPGQVVDRLQQELDVLKAPEGVVLVLMGIGTARVWDAVVQQDNFPATLRDRVRIVCGIRHYTHAGDFSGEIVKMLSAPAP